MCKTLCGNATTEQPKTDEKLTKWPLQKNGQLYELLVDDIDNPDVHCFHDDRRIYPLFAIQVKPANITDKIKVVKCSSVLQPYTMENILKENRLYWCSKKLGEMLQFHACVVFNCGIYYKKISKIEILFPAKDNLCSKLQIYSYEDSDLSCSRDWTKVTEPLSIEYDKRQQTFMSVPLRNNALSQYLVLQFIMDGRDDAFAAIQNIVFFQKLD